MSLHSPLKLLVGGCSMITSCSVWLFEPSNTPMAAAMTLESASPESIYLDNLTPVPKLTNWKGNSIDVQVSKASKYTDGTSIVLKFKDTSKKDAILNQITPVITNFQVTANSTKKEYQDFEKNKINISLFKTPAWSSNSKKEEYEELKHDQIEELFKDNDEVRVKQLLLALTHRIEWIYIGSESYNMYYMNWSFATQLKGLEDLKIRHFQDFNRLKEYVQKKTKTCVDDTRACFPHVDEIDYLEVDRKEYFEKVLSRQST